MKKRRVLLLYTQSLLSDGLQAILSRPEDVELVSLRETDAHLMDRLCEEEPDIVLLAEDGQGEGMSHLMAQILDRCPNLPLIRIGLTHNAMRVYTCRTVPACIADLVEIIRNLPIRR